MQILILVQQNFMSECKITIVENHLIEWIIHEHRNGCGALCFDDGQSV